MADLSKPRNPVDTVIVARAAEQDASMLALLHHATLLQKLNSGSKIADPRWIENETDIYRQGIICRDNAFFIAKTPLFDALPTTTPPATEQPAGFMTLFRGNDPTELRMGQLYTIRSPYPVGSALLLKAIDYALAENYAKIGLVAGYLLSELFFRNVGLFDDCKGVADSSELELYRDNFAPATAQIKRHVQLCP